MKSIRFLAFIFVLILASFPFLVFADGYGPHGDDGMLSAGDQRKLANSGANFMSQSNVANGGTQIRFGVNGGVPDMAPISAPVTTSSNGAVSIGGGYISTVNDALSKGGSYIMSGGTQIFSAQTVSNVIRFSGNDQVGQNSVVSKNANNLAGTDFNSRAMNAIAGLRADPVGVASHAQQLTAFANDPKNVGVSVTNANLLTAGYKIQPYVPSMAQPVVSTVSAGVITGVISDGTGKGGPTYSTSGKVLSGSNTNNKPISGNYISQTNSMYGTP